MRKFLAISAAIATSVIGASAAQASSVNLLQNGSFETYSCALNSRGWCLGGSDNIAGWTGTPNTEIQTHPTLGLTPQDGLAYAELNTNVNASLSQSLILDRGRYELSFYYSPRVDVQTTGTGPNTNGLTYSVGGETGSINDAPNGDVAVGEWLRVTQEFSVTADNTMVTVLFDATGENRTRGCGNCGALLDEVALAAVPLPAGGLLMLAGLGGLIAARRRNAA